MKYIVEARENERLFKGEEGPFIFHGAAAREWIAASPFRTVATFEVEADDVLGAAEAVFAIGNDPAEPADLNGQRWDHRSYRSQSSGDMVIVKTPDGDVPLACMSIGWEPIAPTEVRS